MGKTAKKKAGAKVNTKAMLVPGGLGGFPYARMIAKKISSAIDADHSKNKVVRAFAGARSMKRFAENEAAFRARQKAAGKARQGASSSYGGAAITAIGYGGSSGPSTKIGKLMIKDGDSVLSHHVANQVQCIMEPDKAFPTEFPDGLGINGNIIRSRTNLNFTITANSNGISFYPCPAALIVRSGATYDMSAGTTTTSDSLYASAINVADVQSVRCIGMLVRMTSQTSANSSYPKVNVWQGRLLSHVSRTALTVGLPHTETRGTVLSPERVLQFVWIPTREHDFHPFGKTSTYIASNDEDGAALLTRPAIHMDVVYAGSLTQMDIEVHCLWSLQLAQTAVYRADDVLSPNSTLAKDAALNVCASLVKSGAWYQDEQSTERAKRMLAAILQALMKAGGRLAYKLAEGAWIDWVGAL